MCILLYFKSIKDLSFGPCPQYLSLLLSSHLTGGLSPCDPGSITLGGIKYHLPSVVEWHSVIPPAYVTNQIWDPSNNKNYLSGVTVEGSFDNRVSFNNNTIYHRSGCGETQEWGKKSDGTYEMPPTILYNEYASAPAYQSTSDGVTRYYAYAIRHKPTDTAGPSGYGMYTCAYRYTYTDKDPACNNKPSVRVKARYLGESSLTTLDDIIGDAYWNVTGVEYLEAIFPACGNVSGVDAPAGTTPDHYPGYGFYWSSNAFTSNTGVSSAFVMYFTDAVLHANNWYGQTSASTVRLFYDAY